MTEALAENAPLLAAAISIICGSLLGRRFGSILHPLIWAALLLVLLLLGQFATAKLVEAVISVGVPELVAKYTVIMVLCLISGFGISALAKAGRER